MARRQASQSTRPVHDDDGAPPGNIAPDASGERYADGAARAAGAAAAGADAAATGAPRAGESAARSAGTTGVARGRPRGVTGRALRGLPGGRQEDSPLALDRLIHERLRLGIVSALAVNDALTFVELKGLLHTTDGNLSVHARKLEEAGYISCTKEFDGRTPRTEYRLTRAGRHALERYLDHMDALIKATRTPADPSSPQS